MMEDKRLKEVIDAAHEARKRAYAPYSRFKMGAAVLTEKDVIVQGSLVENISLGLAMCVERTALFSTIAQDAGRTKLLVLVSRRTNYNFAHFLEHLTGVTFNIVLSNLAI